MTEARIGGFFCLAYVGECVPLVAGRTWGEVGEAFGDLIECANPPRSEPHTPDELLPRVVAFIEGNLDVDGHDDEERSYLAMIIDSAVVQHPGWHAWTQVINDGAALAVCVGVHGDHFRACCMCDHPVVETDDRALVFELNMF